MPTGKHQADPEACDLHAQGVHDYIDATHWWGISLMYEVYIRKCLIRLVLGTISLIRRPPRYDPDMRDI